MEMSKENLQELLDRHKLWLSSDGEQGIRANLSHADLHGANLHGADLHGANLHDADLHDANLHGADLSDADLSDADLHGANLHGADLSGADLSDADLSDANLDYSSGLPMSCRGLNVNIDDRLAIQMLYHCLNNVMNSTNVSAELKASLLTIGNIDVANRFHRTGECGLIKAEVQS